MNSYCLINHAWIHHFALEPEGKVERAISRPHNSLTGLEKLIKFQFPTEQPFRAVNSHAAALDAYVADKPSACSAWSLMLCLD